MNFILFVSTTYIVQLIQNDFSIGRDRTNNKTKKSVIQFAKEVEKYLVFFALNELPLHFGISFDILLYCWIALSLPIDLLFHWNCSSSLLFSTENDPYHISFFVCYCQIGICIMYRQFHNNVSAPICTRPHRFRDIVMT